jgi:hypothetical protein
MPRIAASHALLVCLMLAGPVLASARTCVPPDSWLRLPDAELIARYRETSCAAQRAEIAVQLSVRLDRGDLDDDLDARTIRHLRHEVAFDGLRHALLHRDRLAIERSMAALERMTGERDGVRVDDTSEMFGAFEQRGPEIRRILDGRIAPPPIASRLDAVPDWTLQFGFCGTPLMMFYREATAFPEAEDAWIAVGREDLAIQSLLQRQWVAAIGLGMAPPRLREYGERIFGNGGYRREVESALAGIRIDDTATGRTAFIPLLGQWLPLPTAIQSYGDEQPRGFSSPDVLAEWLRPMLLGREEDSAD